MIRLIASNTIVRLALLFTLIVSVLIGAGMFGWQQVRREVAERARAEVDRAVGAVLDHPDSDGATFDASVRAAVSELRAKTARLGAPSLAPSGERDALTLRFGDHDATEERALLSNLTASDAVSASLYILRDHRFSPLAPVPQVSDGRPVAAAPLEANSEAFASLWADRPFTGPVETDDHRYFGHFEPMVDAQGGVIGAYGATHPLELLDEIAQELSGSPVFSHGFLGIVDRNGGVIFRTANLDLAWLRPGRAGHFRRGSDADGRLRGYELLWTDAGRRDVKILAGVADADLDAQTLRLTGAALSIVGVVILMALCLAWLQARRLTEALAEAEQARAAAEAAGAALDNELEQAAKYVESLLPPRTLDGQVAADWLYQPSVGVGGDAFGYHWLDEQHFAFYLLDVCGHGVGAALLATTVMNVIRTGTTYGAEFCAPATVLAALNNSFPMEAQNGMYFTIWYGVYDTASRDLTFAAAGHHPAVLLGPVGPPEFLRGKGLPIGCFADVEYPSFTTTIPPGARLYVFSDGIFEIERVDRSGMMTFEEFVDVILDWRTKHRDKKLGFVLECVQTLQGKSKFDDDCALMELKFDAHREMVKAA